MVSTRYYRKDLKLARGHTVKAAYRIADQEMVIRKLSLKGRPCGLAYALLDRLYDDQRRKLERLKLIEAMVEVKAQSCVGTSLHQDTPAPPSAMVRTGVISTGPATPLRLVPQVSEAHICDGGSL